MTAPITSRTYFWLLLALIGLALLPAAGLNLLLLRNSLSADRNRMASDWQQATHGVTYAPPISQNRPFKTLRLNDRIGEINAVVFGSSTMMSITSDAFPPPLVVYNFAQSGNPLIAMVAEADYVVARWGSQLKVLVIPLDWALGFVYDRGEPPPTELTPEAVERDVAASRPSFAAQLTDALSAPRMTVLAGVIRDIMKAPDIPAAVRQVFLDPAGPEYRCADGTPARDFDVVYRGLCNGFRHDGSATFADQKRLDAGRAPAALAAAASGASQYAQALRKGGGEPAQSLLDRVARVAHAFEAQGGTVLLLMPPLMPGLEEALARTEPGGPLLRTTKQALASWSARERIALLDAGDSGRFGCVVTEFIDPHHALPACYRKVFSRFFGDHPRWPAPGISAKR